MRRRCYSLLKFRLITCIVAVFALSRSGLSAENEQVRWTPDIVFATVADETLKLNLARPASGDGPFPVIVCIHGGGFSGGRREDYDDLCRKFAARGFAAATIDYRLSPKHRWPAHIYDCKASIRWLRAHAAEYRLDPDKIGAMGSSAGGHLSQFLAVTNDVQEFVGDHTHLDQSSKVNCVAAWAQASDFTREYGVWKEAPEAFKGFLGADLTAQTRRLHVRASPLFWVTPNAAPTLLVHGTADQDVLFVQSVWIHERLLSAEVETHLVPIEGGGHGLTGAHLHQAEQATFEFFEQQFQLKK
ncbi:alpha/beta hydrolase fold domain-containing protein [Schlesneria sp. T3-172]|uniref:alpha/beta hydrolase fold domain-containing protein n=1 Tax=Schlesneria sphaerica TaxID=3373610 RepID=UPI0037C78C60